MRGAVELLPFTHFSYAPASHTLTPWLCGGASRYPGDEASPWHSALSGRLHPFGMGSTGSGDHRSRSERTPTRLRVDPLTAESRKGARSD